MALSKTEVAQPTRWALIETQYLDSEVGLETYEVGEFDSEDEARAHIAEYARQRGQVPESMDFLVEPR